MGGVLEPQDITASWKKRNDVENDRLRQKLDCSDASPIGVALSLLKLDDWPPGDARATVFLRSRWDLESSYQAGIRFTTADGATNQYVPLCMTDGEYCVPVDGVTEAEAAALGNMALAKVRWAALRGVQLDNDATELRLPPVPAIPPTT